MKMTMDLQEQIARIEKMQEETRKYAAETRKIRGNHDVAGWQIAIVCAAGVALFAVGAAFIKLMAA